MAAKRTSAGRFAATMGSGAGRKFTYFFLVAFFTYMKLELY